MSVEEVDYLLFDTAKLRILAICLEPIIKSVIGIAVYFVKGCCYNAVRKQREVHVVALLPGDWVKFGS